MNLLNIILIAWIISYVISMTAVNSLIRHNIIIDITLVKAIPSWLFYLIGVIVTPLYILPSLIFWMIILILYLKVGDYKLTWVLISDSFKNKK